MIDNTFLQDVVLGLSTPQKTLPCKYFYDAYGSEIFEKICLCQDYYVTRTETALLQDIALELTALLDGATALIEPGAGAMHKASLLLAKTPALAVYLPTDISADFLKNAAQRVAQNFPNIPIEPISGDFTQEIDVSAMVEKYNIKRRMVFFPGSTFGNFNKSYGLEFLHKMRLLAGDNGGLIIGIDAVKPVDVLERAYNDTEGLTADFNKNILQRINQELQGDFDLDNFTHRAIFNEHKSRIEMNLFSDIAQKVTIAGGHEFSFAKDEFIHTENSYKYTPEKFAEIASQAGFTLQKYWSDPQNYFYVYYLS